jgi:anion exchange protein
LDDSLDDKEGADISVRVDPLALKWVVSGGNSHDRFEVGRCIGGIFSMEEYKVSGRTDKEEIKRSIDSFLENSTLVPFNSWDPRFRMLPPVVDEDVPKWMDPDLRKTIQHAGNKVEGGLISDVKFKLKYYLSDFIDALDVQCISAIIFCYFVNITPIVTFGSITQDDTNRWIGTIESIIGAGICGIVWALTGGQPLIIISQTGPMLIFDRILYELSEKWDDIEFLNFRFFVGIWTFVFLFLIVIFKLSRYVKYITNFTEECFACLISLIFIVDGFKKIAKSINIKQWPKCEDLVPVDLFDVEANNTHYAETRNMTPVVLGSWEYESCEEILEKAEDYVLTNPMDTNNTAYDFACMSYTTCKESAGFFGIILSIMTLVLCFFFRSFRTGQIFPSGVKKQLANFGVILSILICVGVDIGADLPTYKLKVPKKFTTTRDDRDWIIDIKWETKFFFVAILPALLCTVLVFLDQQITAVIINRPANKLKKGCGYHLDLLVVGALIPLCCLLGLPLYVAATVRSIAHVQSLHRYDNDVSPGQPPKFIGVIEQRVTGLIVFILIFVSVFASKILVKIPLNVLYGVFVYMGVTALLDLNIVERTLLLVTPVKHQPDRPYLRRVRLKAVHTFTLIQLVCLAVLYAIKSISDTAIAFPVMIVVIVIIRKLLEYVYSKDELMALDGH